MERVQYKRTILAPPAFPIEEGRGADAPPPPSSVGIPGTNRFSHLSGKTRTAECWMNAALIMQYSSTMLILFE